MAEMLGNAASPATEAEPITKSDSVTLRVPTRGIFVGVAGVVRVRMVSRQLPADTVDFNAAAGTVLPISVIQVMDTGTTASSLVALW